MLKLSGKQYSTLYNLVNHKSKSFPKVIWYDLDAIYLVRDGEVWVRLRFDEPPFSGSFIIPRVEEWWTITRGDYFEIAEEATLWLDRDGNLKQRADTPVWIDYTMHQLVFSAIEMVDTYRSVRIPQKNMLLLSEVAKTFSVENKKGMNMSTMKIDSMDCLVGTWRAELGTLTFIAKGI